MKLFPALLATGLILGACNPPQEEAVQPAGNSVEAAMRSRDSIENALVSTMDEINRNLDQIREKEGLISQSGGGDEVSKKEEILRNITLINSLIEQNKQKIEELTKQAKKLGGEKNAMRKLAKQTQARIEQQEKEIAELKEKLAQESFKVTELNQRLDEAAMANEMLTSEKTILSENNAEMDIKMNRGYFMYGTSKELLDKKLVEKKGGILGLGKKEQLANTFYQNKALFTEIDIRETKTISVAGKKPKLITFHPQGTYEWKDGESKEFAILNITKPEEFWSSSRYLLIEVK